MTFNRLEHIRIFGFQPFIDKVEVVSTARQLLRLRVAEAPGVVLVKQLLVFVLQVDGAKILSMTARKLLSQFIYLPLVYIQQ